MNKLFLTTLVLMMFSACDNKQAQIERGEKLFHEVHIGKTNVIGCISCHSLKPDIETVGPSLYAIGLRADKLVQGMNAQEYLSESITNPDAYIVSGYTPAVMFAHYQSELSEDEIESLVVFLSKLK